MASPETNPAGPIEFEAQRAELERVLGADLFKRSPRLSHFLSYICEKYFRGEAAGVTECSIALDVLGRNANFDPQVDSVVRVEAHHLRKRLRQYYENGGKDAALQIVLPSGQYTPEFHHRELAAAVAELPVEALAGGDGPISAGNAWTRAHRWFGLAAAVLLTVGLFGASLVLGRAGHLGGSKRQAAVAGDEAAIRIVAGQRDTDYIDRAGRTWLSDRYFIGGQTFRRPRPILRTQDQEIYQSGREGQFAYEIPLKPGSYQLQLYFAETSVASEGLRSISLAINGRPQATLDIACDAGGADTATIKIYKDVSPAKDGLLHLTFQSSGPSFVNAIEVLPAMPGKMRPLRFTARDTAFRDSTGRLWLPDLGFSGGRLSARHSTVSGTDAPALYLAQRFGHFNYSIPVVEGGSYTVTLHFAETWFGLPNSDGGIGSRIFDVYCNGSTLLKGFDILKGTGGVGGRALVETFRHLEASPQGKLELNFVPVVNYALLTAIEVTED